MSSDGQDVGGALLVAALPMAGGTAFERHAHARHQLAWTDAGALEVSTDVGTWVLPPTRALWLPAGVAHRTAALGATVLRGVYVDPAGSPVTWREATPVDVSPLLAALLLHLGEDLPAGARDRAEAILPDLLTAVGATAIRLVLPHDPRAAEVAAALLTDPADDRPLAAWGRAVGASERTLRRGFAQGTGLTFARWRTAVRVRASLAHLAGGESVSAVSATVGYATPSAFVAAFRRETGTTPAAYFRRG